MMNDSIVGGWAKARSQRAGLAARAVLALAVLSVRTSDGQTAELIVNGDFSAGGEAWWGTSNLSTQSDDGRLCLEVPGGTTAPWDAIFGQSALPIVQGETYELAFSAQALPGPVVVRALVQNPTTYATFLDRNPTLTSEVQRYRYTFTAGSSLDEAELAFQVGGSSAGFSLCIDDVSLTSGATPIVYTPDTGPRVRVNQVGYLPFGPKGATVVTPAQAPLPWRLTSSTGELVASGLSRPHGVDATSGLAVHEIRFDHVRAVGTGHRLEADGETSHPFDISVAPFRALRADAFRVFYTQRSGVPIEGAFAGEAYARPAGHAGIAPNQGDFAVPCQPEAATLAAYGEAWTCDYTLDVHGGWYDAGDHGKYVVNGGIATAQLLSIYERSLHFGARGDWARRDGTLSIPERANGVPDVLDEARFELEWMLRMQVPSGEPLAGMVHHKVHDDQWTGLPLMPAADDRPRQLHRPSTAATLNLAAVAAQGARLYRRFDQDFSARLLEAAERAWRAAEENPVLYAPPSDGTGGGSYSDSDVSDERYWAAAELYLTTGSDAYAAAVLSSPLHTAEVFDVDGFAWNSMAALGRMALATHPSTLPGRRQIRRSVLAGADAILAVARAQPWGQAYAPASGAWVWGSSGNLLNNLIVLATAYDLSGKRAYRDAVIEGLDFVLGRNALNRSFVTGYGDVYSENQHSRWYAAQLNAELPHPPRGTIAGGPNTSLADPVARENLTGCVGQLCYIDDIGSYSTNELAINWNAPLAWVAAFVAERGHAR